MKYLYLSACFSTWLRYELLEMASTWLHVCFACCTCQNTKYISGTLKYVILVIFNIKSIVSTDLSLVHTQLISPLWLLLFIITTENVHTWTNMCNYTLYVDVSKFVYLFVWPNAYRLRIILELMYLTLTLIARDDYLPTDEFCSQVHSSTQVWLTLSVFWLFFYERVNIPMMICSFEHICCL